MMIIISSFLSSIMGKIKPTCLHTYCVLSDAVYYRKDSSLHNERIFKYNTSVFDFNHEVKLVLQNHWCHYFDKFGPMHCLEVGSYFHLDRNNNRINALQHRWNRDRSRELVGSDYVSFDKLYRRFIKEVIGPSMGGENRIVPPDH